MSDGVIVALIGAAAGSFGAWMSYLAQRAAGHARDEAGQARAEAAAANQAVNQRPAGEPSIYELVATCAADTKAARTAAEHAQGIVTEVAGEQQRHLAWHQRDEEQRLLRQAALDDRLGDVVDRLDAGAARFARLERVLGVDPDDDTAET